MSAAIAIFSQKGGVGKTSVTIHLAGALAFLGKRVLVLDLDGQADLTSHIGFTQDVYADDGYSIFNLLMDLKGNPNPLIRRAPHDNFDAIPGNASMYLAADMLSGQRNRERRLERVLSRIEREYDYILVDCPPGLDVVSDNAILACRRVLIPTEMHDTYRRTLRRLFEQVETLENTFDVQIAILGVVPVAYEPSSDQKAFLEALRGTIPKYMAPELRKRKTLIDDARRSGSSIFNYTPGNAYRKKAQRESQEDYLSLAKFVIQRTGERTA